KAPTNPLPRTAKALLLVIGPSFTINFRIKLVIVQKRKRIVNALDTPETSLTNLATCSGPEANMAKKAPIICNKGAPGGCPTCNSAEVAIYSPAAQKLTVGSTVMA